MRNGTRIAFIIGAVAVGAALALLTSDRWRRPAPDLTTTAAPAPTPTPAVAPEVVAPAAPPPRVAVPDESGEIRIATNETIQIDTASLVPGKPVVLRLALAEPSRSEDPRPVRVLSEQGRVFEGQGSLGSGRTDARFEVDPAFLSAPGRYIVEVKTTELSHFPLRRYVLEVR